MNQQEHFLNTVKNRGFFVKQAAEKLFQKAKFFDYDELCVKLETLMDKFVQ